MRETSFVVSLILCVFTACSAGIPIGDSSQPTAVPPHPTSSVLPLGEPVAMGTRDVLLVHSTIPGRASAAIEIVSIDLHVTASNGLSGAPSAFLNYRLAVGTSVFSKAQNLDTSSHSSKFDLTFPVVSPLMVGKNASIDVSFMADVNTWQNLQPTGLHTRTHQINVVAEITGYYYREVGSVNIVRVPLTSKGKTLSVLRAFPSLVVAAPSAPTGYSTVVITPATITSAYTIVAFGARSERVVQESFQFYWSTSGLASTSDTLNYAVFATPSSNLNTLGMAVAWGKTNISKTLDGSFETAVNQPGAPALSGVEILTDAIGGETFTVSFGVASSFAPQLNVLHAIGTRLEGGTWNDGTRGPLPLNLPSSIPGHIVQD